MSFGFLNSNSNGWFLTLLSCSPSICLTSPFAEANVLAKSRMSEYIQETVTATRRFWSSAILLNGSPSDTLDKNIETSSLSSLSSWCAFHVLTANAALPMPHCTRPSTSPSLFPFLAIHRYPFAIPHSLSGFITLALIEFALCFLPDSCPPIKIFSPPCQGVIFITINQHLFMAHHLCKFD